MRPRQRVHYGWLVCLGCALLLFCTSGLSVNTFTVYQPYILEQNHFTNAQSSMILMVRNVFSLLSMLLAGIYYRHLSLRQGMGLAGLLTTAGFVFFALSRSYFAYCLSGAVIGLAYGVGTMIPISIVLEHWFVQKRTMAISLCSAVTGLSTLGIPTLLTELIERQGLRFAFLVNAAAVFVLCLLSHLLIRSAPEEKGMAPYGAGEATVEKTVARRSGSLIGRDWLMLVPMLLLLGAVTSVGFTHLTVLIKGQGFSAHTAALGVTVIGVALTVGKLFYGALSEKLSTFHSNWLFGGLIALGLLLICFARGSHLRLYVGLLVYGVSLSMNTVGLTAWAGDLSGPGRFDETIRRFNMGYAAGSMLFSPLPGILADLSKGSYVPAYLLFALFSLVQLLLIQGVYIRCSHRKAG